MPSQIKLTQADKNENRLSEVLSQYQLIANSDPLKLRKCIPSEEVWRFFVTEEHQVNGRSLRQQLSSQCNGYEDYTLFRYITQIEKTDLLNPRKIPPDSILTVLRESFWDLSIAELKQLTFQDLFALDHGLGSYEVNEQGYFKSLYFTFDDIFKSSELTIELIKDLHAKTIAFTKNTRCDLPEFKHVKNRFRDEDNLRSHLDSDTCTLAGIQQILFKQSQHDLGHLQISIEFNGCALFLTSELLEFIKSNIEFILNDPKLLAVLFDTTVEDFRFFPDRLIKAKSVCFQLYNDDTANYIFRLCHSPDFEVFLNSKPEGTLCVEDKLTILINKYNAALLKMTSPLKKLTAVTEFIQDCAQLVLFIGANGRTICMILANLLLVRNGFPLYIPNEQNRFIGFSTDELVSEMIQGMENTFSLIQNKELFNILTADIFLAMRHTKFRNLDKYFASIVISEENARYKNFSLNRALDTSQFGIRFFQNNKEQEILYRLKNVLDQVYPEERAIMDPEMAKKRSNYLQVISFLKHKFLSKSHRDYFEEHIEKLNQQMLNQDIDEIKAALKPL